MDETLTAPRFHRSNLGDFQLTVVSDGARSIPLPPRFVLNATNEEVLKVAEAAGMPKGTVVGPFNPMVVDTGSKRIMIDTGYGPLSPTVGRLPQSLAAAGIDPKSIDIVLISHLHGDHINGIRNPDGSLAFPNAEIKVPAVEAAFWGDDANQSKANGFNKGQFAAVKKMMDGLKVTPYEADKEVAPGITSIFTPGHTPGHTSFVIASANKKLLVQSDVTNIPSLFLRNPDWQVTFDNDPNLSVATRHKFYDMAAAEKMTVVGYHFPYPCVGHVEKDGAGYRLIPVAWDPNG